MASLFQAGALISFLQGIYDGDCTFAKLASKGNIGLGTFNAVDGEMIAVDGVFYRIDGKGVAQTAKPTDKTPFSIVSMFEQVESFTINNINSLADLSKLLDANLKTPNIMHMIRIDAELDLIKMRSEECQLRPYRQLSETLPQLQHTFTLPNTRGTLVATYCPNYLSAITFPGYHYHYIDHSRLTGGHVFDLQIKSAIVTMNPIRDFELSLTNSDEFDHVNLAIDIQAALKKIE